MPNARVALVTWDVGPAAGPNGVFAEVILRGHERFDFVVVSRTLLPELRSLVEWHRAPAPGAPFHLKWATFYGTAGARLTRIRADVIHTRGPAPRVPNRVDLASVNFIHAGYHEAADGRPPGANPLTWRAARAFTLALERRSYGGGRASLLDVDTEGAKAAIERHYPGVPVVVTPRGIDTDRFRPDSEVRRRVRAQEGADDDEIVALFVAREWQPKGLDLAIDGLARARQRSDHRLVLWVAGRDDARELARLASRFGMEDRVRLLGYRADVERLYAAADLLLLPTLYETFSRAAHEAAASELPVVAPAVHGVQELIGDDAAGVVVERDAGSIAEAVLRLAVDPELRSRMGKTGRARCRGLTEERSVGRVLELYDRLARSPARSV